jgi:3-methyl-2-oxobutanoate hydroxymethyltransferase
VQAVVRGTSHTVVVGDLPFGAYQESAEVALAASVGHLKEGAAKRSSWRVAAGCCCAADADFV